MMDIYIKGRIKQMTGAPKDICQCGNCKRYRGTPEFKGHIFSAWINEVDHTSLNTILDDLVFDPKNKGKQISITIKAEVLE